MTACSSIKADTGGFVGHSAVHPEMLSTAQDLLSDAFSGKLRGVGAGYAEPVIRFLADKTGPGAWNLRPHKMRSGFSFEVYDLYEESRIVFDCPERIYDLLIAFPHSLVGCMRGSHHAPVVPVSQSHPARFDGARRQAGEIMDYLRRHGPFEPHRLALKDLEYTTMHALEERLTDRWQPLPAQPVPAGH